MNDLHEHDPHSPSADAHHVAKHVRLYIAVGVSLLLLTILTVGLSYVNFGTQQANIVVALIVATLKACLVAAVFMHLASEKWTIYRFLIFTLIAASGLFLLTYCAFHDPIHY